MISRQIFYLQIFDSLDHLLLGYVVSFLVPALGIFQHFLPILLCFCEIYLIVLTEGKHRLTHSYLNILKIIIEEGKRIIIGMFYKPILIFCEIRTILGKKDQRLIDCWKVTISDLEYLPFMEIIVEDIVEELRIETENSCMIWRMMIDCPDFSGLKNLINLFESLRYQGSSSEKNEA